MRQSTETLGSRTNLRLQIFDASLQVSTILALALAIVSLVTQASSQVYLLAAPLVPMAIWAASGLVIDRQALR